MSDDQANGRMVMVGSGAAAVPEQRDPSAATLPLRWYTPGLAQAPNWDATGAFKDGYEASVWVSRCVNLIANTIAALPFRAGYDPDSPESFDTEAPLAKLLGPAPGGPAPGLSARRWWAWQITQYLVAGRFAAELDIVGGAVTALWPWPAAVVKPVPTKSGSAWFAAFDFDPGNGNVKRFPADRVLYAWRPSGRDFREPESVLQAASLPISVQVLLDRYSYSFVKNDARPAQVVVTQAFADQEGLDAFKAQFLTEHQGPWNAGKTAFVEADDASEAKAAVSIQTMGLSQKDAQMLETADAAAEAICVGLGVPLSLLDASGRTFSNAAEEKRTFLNNTILPLIADLEDAINNQLAPRLGRHVGWFDLSGVPELKRPPKFDPGQGVLLVERRIITPNEMRAELGLAPISGGDVLVDLPPAPDPAAQRSTTVVELHGFAGAAGAPEERARGAKVLSWRTLDAKARVVEQSWVGTLRSLFEKQRKTVMANVEGRKHRTRIEAAVRDGAPLDPVQIAGIFDQSRWRAETSTIAEDLYRRALALGLDRVADKFAISFDLSDPWAVDLILARANDLAGHTTATTCAKIQQALIDGVQEGEAITDIAKRVEAVFDEAVGSRAAVIARTEVISASNGAVDMASTALPEDVVGGKTWIAAEDERTRDSHAAADGQVVGRGGTFDIGGTALRYPGDPAGDAAETVNCRCAMGLLTPEEMPK